MSTAFSFPLTKMFPWLNCWNP